MHSTLPAAAPVPLFPALPELPLPPQGGYAAVFSVPKSSRPSLASPSPRSVVRKRRGRSRQFRHSETAHVAIAPLAPEQREVARLKARIAALETAYAAQQLAPEAHYAATLARNWARAAHLWLPLCLVVVKLADELNTPCARDAVGLALASSCREIDVAFELGQGRYAIVMLGTSRTAAEAECNELERVLANALLRTTGANAYAGAALGIGLALAFDDAEHPGQLAGLASERAELAAAGDGLIDSCAKTVPLPLVNSGATLDSSDAWTLPAASDTERHHSLPDPLR